MFTIFREELNRIDSVISSASAEEIPKLFSNIPVDVFAMLTLNVGGRIPDLGSISRKVLDNAEPIHYLDQHPWPEIAKTLPTMPSDNDQRQWNGTSGINLMQKTLAAYKSLTGNFRNLTGKDFHESKVLDFGCGWGRILRLFCKDVPYTNLYGADPWQRSLDNCRSHNLKCNFGNVAWVADSLPFGDVKFDLVFAYSVFTHLSLPSTGAALKAIRNRMNKDGLLAITIRPEEYWRLHKISHDKDLDLNAILSVHREKGFAFVPHKGSGQGNVNYGDTSMTPDFIAKNWPEWKLAGTDLNITDPHQMLVFLKPV